MTTKKGVSPEAWMIAGSGLCRHYQKKYLLHEGDCGFSKISIRHPNQQPDTHNIGSAF
jgi:hypothetical protein